MVTIEVNRLLKVFCCSIWAESIRFVSSFIPPLVSSIDFVILITFRWIMLRIKF
ncbi:MAG: hypothetical protein ACTS6A_02605 [Candidatus Hodgkinia cicadicola]